MHSAANSPSSARRAKGNDDTQDHCVGLRAGGCRGHAQDQTRHATGVAAPRSGNRHYPSAANARPGGAALNAMRPAASGRRPSCRSWYAKLDPQLGAPAVPSDCGLQSPRHRRLGLRVRRWYWRLRRRRWYRRGLACWGSDGSRRRRRWGDLRKDFHVCGFQSGNLARHLV
jgi:hypothetical protein